MLLEFKYKGKAPSLLPGQTVFEEYLTYDRGYESHTVLKILEDSVRELSGKLHRTRQYFLKQLSKNATLWELEKLEREALLNLKAANNSVRVVDSFSKKYASIQGRVCLEDLSKTVRGNQCLQRLIRICRDMNQLFCEDNLAEGRLDEFSKKMRAQLRELSNYDDPEQTDFHTEVELMLTSRFAQTRLWEVNLRKYLRRARRVLDIIDGVAQSQSIHYQDWAKRLLPLLQVKGAMKMLRKLISTSGQQSSMLETLRRTVDQISDSLQQVATVVEATVLQAQLQVAASTAMSARLSNIVEGTLRLESLLELLKFAQELTLSRSEFDTWVIAANYEKKIVALEEYQYKSLALKEKLDKLKSREFAIDADDASFYLEQVAQQYSICFRSPIEVFRALQPLQGSDVQAENNPDYVNLVKLIDSSKRLQKLCRSKGIVAWVMQLKGLCAKVRVYRRQAKTDLDSLRRPIAQIISTKEHINRACSELGGVLKVVYNNPFTANINKINQLLEKYVWTRSSSFEAEMLESLLTEFSQAGEGCKPEFEWGALCWSIAKLLTKSLQFEDNPTRIAEATEDQYEKWCASLSENARLRSSVRELASRISQIKSAVSDKVSSQLRELVMPFDDFLEVHRNIESIQSKRKAITSPEMLTSKLELLFECVFTRKGDAETKEQLQEMYTLSLGNSIIDSCNLIKLRHDKFIEQFGIYTETIKGTNFQQTSASKERYSRFVELWRLLLKGTEGLESMSPQLEETLTKHIRGLVTACCDGFAVQAQQSTVASIFSTKSQAVEVLQIVEGLMQTTLRINLLSVSNIALVTSRSLFGANNFDQSELQEFTKAITEAVDTINRFSQPLANLQQLQKLKNRLSAVAELLIQSDQDKSMLLSQMVQLIKPPDSGWWTLRARNSPKQLFYGLSQQAVLNFLKELISRIAPQMSASQKDTFLEETVDIQGQACEVNSVNQFHCVLNQTLENQVLHISKGEDFERELNKVYSELWKGALSVDNNDTLIESLEVFASKCMAVQMKASEEISKRNCVVGFKDSVAGRRRRIERERAKLRQFASSMQDRFINVGDLHEFSVVVKDLNCVSFARFTEFKDLESGLTYFLYASRLSLEKFVGRGLLLLFKPERRKELEHNKSLMKWWISRTLLLPQTDAGTLLEKLRASYSIESVIGGLPSLTDTVKELVNRISRINQASSERSRTFSMHSRSSEINDIELYLENLQFQSDSIRLDVLERVRWLNGLRDCMRSTLDQLQELRTWLQEAEGVASAVNTDLGKVQQLAASLKRTRPAFGLRKEIRLLLDCKQQALVAFVVEEEGDPLASASKLFRRFYAGELDFSEEVVGRCLQLTEEGDVEVVPSMFKLSFFEVDVDEPDREVQLQCYSIRLSVHGKVLQTNLPLAPVEMSLSIHEISALQATLFFNDGSEPASSTDKLLSGNEILFRQVSSRVKIHSKDRASKLKLSGLEAAATNDGSANNNLRCLPVELPALSVICKVTPSS